MRHPFAILSLAMMVAGCNSTSPIEMDVSPRAPDTYLDKMAMMDPMTCKECHSEHFEQWSGSMHAYASIDPVFLAMNALGQEETNGELGDFCVQCHAPMALRLGLTTDGLNLADIPTYAQGVTCFFCHTAEAVTGAHNAPIELANDLVMRGSYGDPVPNEAHASTYSQLLDRKRIESADLCGSCHDIVTPKGVHLERTFAEWKLSLFSNETPGEQQTCGNCHMSGRDDVAADYDGVFFRQVHDHTMVGVDTALTAFPGMEVQKQEIQQELNTTVLAKLCVTEFAGVVSIELRLENMAAGHSWPSGAAQDRRAWVEVIAYDAEDEISFQTGAVQEGQALTSLDDPNLWRLGDRTFDEEGHEAHMFWQVASVESELLQAPTAHSFTDPEYTDIHRMKTYTYTGPVPERVTLRVRIRSIGLDVIDYLLELTDLDPAIREAIPTFTLGATQLTWTKDEGLDCIPVGHKD